MEAETHVWGATSIWWWRVHSKKSVISSSISGLHRFTVIFGFNFAKERTFYHF
jgi:hypothetical protein